MAVLSGVLAIVGCAPETQPLGLDGLPPALAGTLPPDAELIVGQQHDDACFWLIHSKEPWPLELPDDAGDKEVIPAAVLVGLLQQFNVPADSSLSSKPGELIEYQGAAGLVRVRRFETSTGWYVFVDQFC